MILFRNLLKTILILELLTPIQSGAATQCPDDIQVLNKGQVANCDGLLFSPEASKKVDENQEDLKHYKTLSEKLQVRQDYMNKENEILDKRLKLYVDQSNGLAERLISQENRSGWEKAFYFGLGVIVTGVAVHGAAQLSK